MHRMELRVIKGCARVSADGQELATQYELLKEAGATLVFSEKQSGIKTIGLHYRDAWLR
jgi:hypothetical protein